MSVVLTEGVRFGHEVAVWPIEASATVTKYGMLIGEALLEIEPVTWVHVQNRRSHRYGFRQEKYGVRA